MKTAANQSSTNQKNDFVPLGKLKWGFAKDSNTIFSVFVFKQ